MKTKNNQLLTASIILLVASTLTGCTHSKVVIAKETAALQQRSKEVTAQEEAKNIPGIMKYWAKDAIAQPAGAPQVQGTEAITKLYHQLFDDISMRFKKMESTSISSPNIVVSASGDIAYDYGVNRVVYSTAKGDVLDVGKYLLVWKKIDGLWYVQAISFTSDAPAPVPVKK